MKRFTLSAEPRKITGKQVKKLRREGILPANVYGKDIKSQSLQLPQNEFNKIYEEAGETGVINLTVGNETIPVLIHNLHKDYKNDVIHADFFKVNLKEKVKTVIPISLVGEPKAVTEETGLLMNITSEVEIEALPTDLPENIEVNIEHLANIDDQILISDLKAPVDVEILSDPNLVVVKIGELVTKEALEEAAAEEAAAEAASTENAEGETTESGEKSESSEEAQESPSPEASEQKSE